MAHSKVGTTAIEIQASFESVVSGSAFGADIPVSQIVSSTSIKRASEIAGFSRGSDFHGIVPATLRTLVPESSRTPARVD